MDDLISRQAVLVIVEREQFKGDAISEIEKLPSVQPEQKMGKWQHYCYQNCQCSECGYIIAESDKDEFLFCPNCGAKMEGVAKDET